jgi:Fe(3+) dicitrate transport protein
MHIIRNCFSGVPFMRSVFLASAAACAFVAPSFAQTESAVQSASSARDVIVVIGLSGDPNDVPGSAEVLTAADLDVQDYSDINRSLRAVPGVNMQEEDGYGLRPNIGLRGTGLDRSANITLMEDGILIAPAPYSAPSAYYFPHTGRMAGIEIIKGAAGVRYGPRTQGGSLNLLSTPVPDEALAGQIDFWVGDEEQRRVHATIGGMQDINQTTRIGGLLETYTNTAAGFKDIDGPSGRDSGFDIEDYVARFRLETQTGNIDHAFELRAQYSDEVSNETYLGLTDSDFAATPFRRYAASALDQMNAEHSLWSLSHTASFGNDLTLGSVLYRTDFARDWYKLDRVDPDGAGPMGAASISSILADPTGNAAAFAILQGAPGLVSANNALRLKHNNRNYYAQGFQTELAGSADIGGTAHDWHVGARFHYDQMDRFQWANHYRMDNGSLVETRRAIPGTDSNRIDSATAFAFFVQDEIVRGRWTFVPGIRFERVELKRENWGGGDTARLNAPTVTENTIDAVIPGLGIRYDVSNSWSLFGGVHRGFAPPAPGSATQEPEDAINTEFGSRWGQGWWSAEGVVFFNAYENLLGSCTNSTGGGCTIGAQFDGGEVNVTGVEFAAEADFGEAFGLDIAIPARLAFTRTQTEFQNSFNSAFDPWGTVLAGDELPYIPENQFYGAVGLDTGQFGGQLALTWVDDVRAIAGQGAIPANQLIESHFVTDASAWWAFRDGLRARISVRNLTDEVYAVARRPAGLRPGAPRAFLFGLSAEF